MRSLLALSLSAAAAGGAAADLPPLIPRAVLFGNPERTGPQISPDGRRLAYLKPDDRNVLQVWVRTRGQADDTPVTADARRGIRQYFWAFDNKHLLYLQDAGGDENFHLFATDLATKATRDLTPYPGVRVQGVELDKRHPNEVLVGLNKRSKAVFDMHRITLADGTDTLDTPNPGTAVGFTPDADFKVRACLVALPAGGFELKVRDAVGQPWRTVKKVSTDEQAAPVAFGANPTDLWVTHNQGHNAQVLAKLDTATGAEQVVAGDREYDVSGALVDDDRRVPLAVGFTRARTEWQPLDGSVNADLVALGKLSPGDFSVVSRTADQQTWVVAYTVDDGPTRFFLYDRVAKTGEFLFSSTGKLDGVTLAKTEPLEYPAKDGLTVRAYLTTPPGVEPKNLPCVLLVHGGPWARDTWGYSPTVQWLANRGYAVLQVNFRGSTGYGKAFLNAGNREWAGKMHQDLLDGLEVVAKKGTIDPKRVAIMGGSYGGYATLVGLTFTPDVFCCGVDIVGPSNIRTLLKTVPPYWGPMRAMFNTRVGDLDKDASFLDSRSPLFRADQIVKPLLIGQGANDPRVKQAESDQIVEAMRKRGKAVEYVLYPDEGHGFQRPENRLHFFAVAEQFLAKHAGGRAEPVGDIPGHSGQVK
jgi:dipeptidyl aminopeptidase/acylaminoacyl peptidase